jgi:hypothetical protein
MEFSESGHKGSSSKPLNTVLKFSAFNTGVSLAPSFTQYTVNAVLT